MFCTLTPSTSPSSKPNATPYIGVPDQNIIVTNTFFDPSIVELEIVEHDASTLAIALYGNQTKSIDDGIYTIYDNNNNIYQQYNLYEIRDQFNELLYEVRQNRGNNIDFSKNFENIIA
jgi:signal transduction histidine kinase